MPGLILRKQAIAAEEEQLLERQRGCKALAQEVRGTGVHPTGGRDHTEPAARLELLDGK